MVCTLCTHQQEESGASYFTLTLHLLMFVPQTIHTFDQHLSEIKSNQGCDARWGQPTYNLKAKGCKLVKGDQITLLQAFSRHSIKHRCLKLPRSVTCTNKFPSGFVTGNEVTLTLSHIMEPQSIQASQVLSEKSAQKKQKYSL